MLHIWYQIHYVLISIIHWMCVTMYFHSYLYWIIKWCIFYPFVCYSAVCFTVVHCKHCSFWWNSAGIYDRTINLFNSSLWRLLTRLFILKLIWNLTPCTTNIKTTSFLCVRVMVRVHYTSTQGRVMVRCTALPLKVELWYVCTALPLNVELWYVCTTLPLKVELWYVALHFHSR